MRIKILDRYILKEILKNVGICLLIFVFIYLTIDFFQKIDDFLEAKISVSVVLKYFFLKLPFIINQMCPVALLIAVIVSFSLMKKYRELIALKASGISIRRIYIPAICLGFFMVIASFLLSELLIPYTSSKAEALWIKEVRKGRYRRFFRRRHIWYRGKNSIYWIERFDGRKMFMEKAVFYFFDKGFHVRKRIQARWVFWKNSRWVSKDVIVQEKRKGKRGYDIQRLDELILNIPETPRDFLRPVRKPEEMNYWQLKKFAKEIEREGYDARRYFVDTYMKLSFPFINLVVVLIGIPASLKIKRESISISVSAGILICALYIFFMGVFRSLGISGIIPPFVAAWMTNIIFFLYGMHLMIHID